MKGHTYSKRKPCLKWDSAVMQHVDGLLTPNARNSPSGKIGTNLSRKLLHCKPRGKCYSKMIRLGQ